MKHLYADANVFLRFLTKDIPAQADQIEKYLLKAEKRQLRISVLPVTIVEILFHLERWYNLPRSEAVEKLVILLSPEWIEVEKKDVILEALHEYKNHTIDFVDIYIWAISKAVNAHILSFDHDFDKLTPSIRIKP